MRDFLARLNPELYAAARMRRGRVIPSAFLPGLTVRFERNTLRATSKSELLTSLFTPFVLLMGSLGLAAAGMSAGRVLAVACGVWVGGKSYAYLRGAPEIAWLKCEVLHAGTGLLFTVAMEATQRGLCWEHFRGPTSLHRIPQRIKGSFPLEHIEASLREICDPLTAVLVCNELEDAMEQEFLTWRQGSHLAPGGVLT